MLKLDPKWDETPESLFQKALNTSDRHLRFRLMALYFVASGYSVIIAASKIGKHRVTVAQWVHKFNAQGIEGVVSKWKGNPGRILDDHELEKLKEIISRHPREVGIKKGRWTAKAVAAYVKKYFGKKIHPDTARNYLHFLGFCRKRPGKKFRKADPEKQKAFAQDLEKLEKNRTHRSVTAYVDEGSLYQDALPRESWYLKGEVATVPSISPGNAKIHFYGAVIRSVGKVITMQVPSFNQRYSAKFIDKIRKKLPGYRIDLVWDNASWHKAQTLQEVFRRNRIHEHRLPTYSPEMNACEYFIRWIKEVLSYNFCWNNLKDLKYAFRAFVATLSRKRNEVLQRCKPKMLGFNIV